MMHKCSTPFFTFFVMLDQTGYMYANVVTLPRVEQCGVSL
jgi:hypothetical protein